MDISKYRSEVQNHIKDLENYRGVDPKRSFQACDELEKYGERIHDDALIGFARFSRGELYYADNSMAEFYREMLSCMRPLENEGEWGYVDMANNLLGIMSLNRGNAPFAMDYYIKAISICHQHRLGDLEWIIHMNMAALYLSIEEYPNALQHAKMGMDYILEHENMPDRIQNLAVSYLDIGKAFLSMGEVDKAKEYAMKLEGECLRALPSMDALVVYCFGARLFHRNNENEMRNRCIMEISRITSSEIMIMDVFDDLYDYLKLLLNLAEESDGIFEDEFKRLIKEVEKLTEKTKVRNLQKKVLSLKARYYREKKMTKEYRSAATEFFEITEKMEQENALMIRNTINLRNNLNDLAMINKEVEQENKELHLKSETDALTGMFNRFKLNTYGDEAFERAYAKQSPFAIEILDIDYFKQYNDNYGHQSGDVCIRAVADMVLSLRAFGNVFCARYGGDEFVIIYENYTEEEVYKMAMELRRRVMGKAIEHKYSLASDIVTISQGICWGVPDADSRLYDYLHGADAMLYQVKEESRNSVKLGRIKEQQ